MPRYLLSVFAPTDADRPGPCGAEDERRRTLTDIADFNRALEQAGMLVSAEGLAPASRARTVDSHGGVLTVDRGAYLPAREQLGGFWIVEADDDDAAEAVAECASRASRGVVEVRPFAG